MSRRTPVLFPGRCQGCLDRGLQAPPMPTAAFCHACSLALPRGVCTICGTANGESDASCRQCSTALDTRGGIQDQARASEAVPMEAEAVVAAVDGGPTTMEHTGGVHDSSPTGGSANQCGSNTPPGLSHMQNVATSGTFPAPTTSSSAASPIRPVTVTDPLATGLSQSLHNGDCVSNTIGAQNAGNRANTTTLAHDFQYFYSQFVEDEFVRSADIITAAHTDGHPRHVPTWQTLASTADSSAIRSLLYALAFNPQSNDTWYILGLSRLEGPKPNTHMLCSRRDVATKLIDSCMPTLNETAREELSRIKSTIAKACDECCDNLAANAQERKSLKGSSRNIPQ